MRVLLIADEAKAMGFIQQVADGGGLPFFATAHRPFSHLIQLSGNVAQRQAGIGNGNRGDELHQMIFRRSAGGAGEELFLSEFFAHHAMNGAAKALGGPVMTASIENPHDILPAMLRPELPHCRQPSLCRRDQIVEIQLLACFRHCLDRLRSALPQTRISGELSSGFSSNNASLGAFSDERPLKLGDSTENLEGEHSLGVEVSIGSRIDRKWTPRSSRFSMTCSR